jgi:hypothetical protein
VNLYPEYDIFEPYQRFVNPPQKTAGTELTGKNNNFKIPRCNRWNISRK